ncbi:hypothetical protein MPTK1_2g19100 [Marchantia polymorpha subsp. ruderalis]|uniref:Uncharacterized protein n=1 Tax=Marchantia polymorpha TaxID=3197 RepID=A0A2R6W8L8_MARPO|nr:hypothetical protein MARPO_0128s0025 [Marchantia polymorpha]BBN02900.1 hypothetical protein Mp_2g19100 [Marchantia polymorpha subsp. ruderalis]|eukprot:PTQ30203.1 hypothetical protein MARPO_0128s0025 [Marchantia polymorpha]
MQALPITHVSFKADKHSSPRSVDRDRGSAPSARFLQRCYLIQEQSRSSDCWEDKTPETHTETLLLEESCLASPTESQQSNIREVVSLGVGLGTVLCSLTT